MIGAGAAGLAAARQLQNFGLQVLHTPAQLFTFHISAFVSLPFFMSYLGSFVLVSDWLIGGGFRGQGANRWKGLG